MKVWIRERALQLIEEQGRTKRWIANFCGINLDSLNHYLAGRRNPPRSIVKLIAFALNTTEAFLMGEDVKILESEEVRFTGT
jgi:transcriptional regulator with XRE-family HTH domain